jgi:hypothetical protein
MNIIRECIIVSKEIDDKFILAKNRDRTYYPKLEVIHELIDGVEVAYLHDEVTDWSEGLNEYGLGVVNSALLVGYDEAEGKLVQNRGGHGEDGAKMRNIFSKKTLKEAIKATLVWKGNNKKGLTGHTFISTHRQMVSVENIPNLKPQLELQNTKSPVVRTNHGHVYVGAGYSGGKKHLSSKVRKISAEKVIDKITNWKQVGAALRNQFFKKDSVLNMRKDTAKMWTSSQTVMNLTETILEVNYYKDKVKSFKGIVNKLPKGYTPKIEIIINKLEAE